MFLSGKFALHKKAVNFFTKRSKKTLKWLFGFSGNPLLHTYRGYITDEGLFFRGRLVEDNGLATPKPGDGWLRNATAMLKRYFCSGISGVWLRISCFGYTLSAVTDLDGYFNIVLPRTFFAYEENTQWSDIKVWVNLPEQLARRTPAAVCQLMRPLPAAEYGIISDIDDTFLISHSTQFFRKIPLMLRKNAYSRLPFAGVASFYQALEKGQSGKANNPFFYISSSEWGLYDLLADFCRVRNIPKGVFLLRMLPNSLRSYFKYQFGNHTHKLQKIREILSGYPKLSFVLVGDTGQKDPEIYHKITEEFPGRIRGIYFREVKSGKRKTARIGKIVGRLSAKNIPTLVSAHTAEAAKHALGQGLISADSYAKMSYHRPKKVRPRTEKPD